MRLHSSVPLCLAAAALLAVAPSARAEPHRALPGCASDAKDFPLTTRLYGGPTSYPAGGGFGVWYLDLTNTTGRTCTGIHPVVVLVDDERALKPTQPRLEFYGDPTDPRPHAVRFETTDEDELVGVLDDFEGFDGFTVGPRRTVTVKVRLAVTSDAVPNRVTANAAVVQRHKGDGDWVGQSNDYHFTIDAPAPHDRSEAARPHTPTGPATPAAPDPDRTHGPATLADELAGTGLTSTPGILLAASLTLLLTGTWLLRAHRRR